MYDETSKLKSKFDTYIITYLYETIIKVKKKKQATKMMHVFRICTYAKFSYS